MNRLPAVVGELVAEMRELAQTSDDCRYGTISTGQVRDWAGRIESTLSALTAEAGKGECVVVTDEMVDAAYDAYETTYSGEYLFSGATDNRATAMRAALEAALALSTATPAGEWREIESAPKDGTAVDVWNGERVPGARWCRPDGGSIDYKDWCVSVPEVDGCSVSWCMENIHPHPTHWRPLPAPPLAASPRGAVESGRG